MVRMDRVAGMMNAAPKPWTARIPMSTVAESAREQAREPAPKMTRPTTRTHLRPSRSPVLPAMSRKLAKTIV